METGPNGIGTPMGRVIGESWRRNEGQVVGFQVKWNAGVNCVPLDLITYGLDKASPTPVG